ncbi:MULTISPECIES: hypothetical protein [Clostridium]|uniref:hypothetical protein n=1 Tax=Clostridium TaxID=1485 RepID=UPI0008261079|nr:MULTISPECIES: hypothetical protein [Clostridium]PJI07042.1 hypothetical protein CUB90_03815 [Clostridium sp. CT7]
MSELKVTSIDELKNMATEVIELSPFSGDKPFCVKVKRLSILGLCQSGKIPNQLLGVARRLFYQDNADQIDLKEYGKLIDIICENTLVEPSVKELREIGLELTDSQQFELWAYSQQGVDGLKSFRTITKDSLNNSDGKNVSSKAKQNLKYKK